MHEPFCVDQLIAGLGVMEGRASSGSSELALVPTDFFSALHQSFRTHRDARLHDHLGVFGAEITQVASGCLWFTTQGIGGFLKILLG